MKSLAWLLLLCFCTASAQVRPVEPVVAAEPANCCCGACAGACGMPECATPPFIPAVAFPGAISTDVRRATAEKTCQQAASPAKFYWSIDREGSSQPVELNVRDHGGTRRTVVPAFMAHCAFLI